MNIYYISEFVVYILIISLYLLVLLRISVANVTSENPAKYGGYAFALFGSKICFVQILAIYHQTSNYYTYFNNIVICIDALSYIFVCIFEEQAPNIFGYISAVESRYILFFTSF